MALRGNLKDFSLPDVFQLVTFSRKSGVLRIRRADNANGSVWFRDGDVFFAQSNWHSELLGERLVRAQRITPQALERALSTRAAQGAGGRRLGEILIDEGYITDKVLEVFVSEQIQETIFDLMRWDEGEFDFEATPEIADEDIGLSVSIENVVMEGSRRLEEWTRIRKKIPSMDVVFKMATAPGEGTFEISLKPMEWNLLLLVDGTRSVAELAYATNRTDFEVARVIYGLFSAGLLEFATDEEIAKLRSEREEREARLVEIEAERTAAFDSETAAVQAREAALQADAETRARAAQESSALVSEPETPVAAAEMPEFLSGGVGPTAEDAAVLEEMMGAVLRPTAAAAPAAEVKLELVPEPVTIAEPEPVAITSLGIEPEPVAIPEPVGEVVAEPTAIPEATEEFSFIPVPPVSDIVEAFTPAPVAAVAPPAGADDGVLAQIQASLAALAELPAPAETLPVAQAPIEQQPETTGAGFEQNLMALGLGELPPELAEPTAEIIIPPRAEPSAETVVAPMGWVDEVIEPLGVSPQSMAAPDAAPVLEDVQGTAVERFAGLADSVDVSQKAGIAQTPAPSSEAAPDFSELLSSLEYEAPAVEAAPVAHADVSYEAEPDVVFDFDEDLLREVSPTAEVGGVISTDSFLEDIGGGELDFSGGLTAELSALTGLGRSTRPTASVNKIPEPVAAGDVLRRDTRVDRDTLLKIIDGIKNL